MNKIDSVKFKVPNSAVEDFNFSKADTKQLFFNRANKQTGKQASITKCSSPGLKSATFNYQSDYSIIECSAKILQEDYYSLINPDTFSLMIDNINAGGDIVLNKAATYCEAEILKVDITTNCELESYEHVKDTVRDLSILSANKKHVLSTYETGIAITERKKTNRERLIAYPKFDEIFFSRKKINKDLRAVIDPEQFRNTLRFESNFKHFSEMRKYFHTPKMNIDKRVGYSGITKAERKVLNTFFPERNKTSIVGNYKLHKVTVIDNQPISFNDIFTSDTNVNYSRFENMFNTKEIDTMNNTIQLIIMSPDSYKQKMKEIAMRDIIAHCNYNLDIIKNFISSQVRGNTSRYIREYDRLLNKMHAEKLENGYFNIQYAAKKLKAA